MPMGPITLNDLVGLDTSLYAGRVVNTAFADRAKTTRILDELVAAGRLGRNPAPASTATPRVARRRRPGPGADPGEVPHRRTADITPEEITDRLFLPMLTEASRVLMEGIVREPGDVDMGLILGIGFPPFRGGLLRWADTLGPRPGAGETEAVRKSRARVPADGADAEAGGGGEGVLRGMTVSIDNG